MSQTGDIIRVQTPNSTAVSEVAFEPRQKAGRIYVVPRNGDRVYQYYGHRELFETIAYAGSVGRAWCDYLREPMDGKGEPPNSMTLNEYEEWLLALETPPPPLITNFPPSHHAW